MKRILGMTLLTVFIGALTIPFLWEAYLLGVQLPAATPDTELIAPPAPEIISRTVGVLA